MNPEAYELVKLFAIVLGPGGAVYLGLKGALNGLKSDIEDIKDMTSDVRDDIRIVVHDLKK